MTQSTGESFDFWNDHSLEFLEMAMKRDFQESVQASDGYGKSARDCGDVVEFYLMKKNGRLSTISYDIQGCLFSHACANTIIKLALNASVEQARTIRAQDIVDYLKTLPEKETHCAAHALAAFNAALDSLGGEKVLL
ncbi:MAG: iron-sulfur cluster assembly scaffold protein [Proteobacteria bacterium]|nr:iron-sulfur cluster assembly scaffold protein [Desulfobacula sp.]MBU3953676.1 iron-sulfur cluster assembly scaffold protein [Pseudomonadota bacterium]MBU4130228.1 iron-sulfur cluster assembly scaffold protein [Pseudomonadota bacterium]